MSWYNPFSWNDSPDEDLEKQRKDALLANAGAAGQFAGTAQTNYNQATQQAQGALRNLYAQGQGQNSVSQLQLGQALQQNQAQQQSIAAGAAPGNAAMAARTAAIQSARLGSGLAGQQAVAGQQERNQAQQQYGQLLQGLRGQDAQTALGSRNTAVQGYSGGAFGQDAQSWLQKNGGTIQGIASVAGALSDRRTKTDIRDGSADADSALKGLKAHFYRYKDEANGAGGRVGIMAQDLEAAGLKHAVIDTPKGKMVHGGHLATALAAMMPGLDKRLSTLEGKKNGDG